METQSITRYGAIKRLVPFVCTLAEGKTFVKIAGGLEDGLPDGIYEIVPGVKYSQDRAPYVNIRRSAIHITKEQQIIPVHVCGFVGERLQFRRELQIGTDDASSALSTTIGTCRGRCCPKKLEHPPH